jgi:hypothetical protein
MKKGDDPTDPGPPPDVDPGPAPELAPQPMPWEPPIDDPEIVAMLKGLKDGSWALDPKSVPTSDGELAAKWGSEAHEPPSPQATPKPEDNVIVWRTGDAPILREGSRRDAADEGVERAADRETVLLPGRKRRRLGVLVAGVLAVSTTIGAAALMRQGPGEHAESAGATRGAKGSPTTSAPSQSTASLPAPQPPAAPVASASATQVPVEPPRPAAASGGPDTNQSRPNATKAAAVPPRVTRPAARPAPSDRSRPEPIDPTKALLPDQP